MTNLRVFLVTAALVLVFVYFPCLCYAQSPLDLEIELSRNHFVVYQPIWLDITLTNITADTLRTDGLTAPNHRQFHIELTDGSGSPVAYQGPLYLLASGPGDLLLGPEERDFGSFDLASLFKSYEETSGYSVIDYFQLVPKGEYTVRVYYEDAVSNELTFTVDEPSGEEKQVLELIEQASSVWNLDNTDPSARIFSEIVERFPNSVYAERCHFMSVTYSMEAREKRRKGPWDFRPVYRAMLTSYPNSGDANGWIMGLTYDMDARAKQIFLNKLAESHPGTRGAKYVGVIQSQLSKQKVGE